MKFSKLALGMGLLTASFVFCACSKENKEATQKEATPATQVAPKSTAKVYPVTSVSPSTGKNAADFTWNENGKQIKFSEFAKDKYVLLNFWGTWCPPCRRELPDLVAIAKEMESKNFLVLGVALERTDVMDEALSGVSQFWNENQLYYNVVIGTQQLTEAYGGISAVPTTFLINKKGEIVNTIQGGRSKEDFMSEINKMMK